MRSHNHNKPDAGFTLIELLVAIAVFAVIVVGMVSLISNLFTVNRQQGSLLASQDEVRKLSLMVMSEMRNATTSDTGAYAIETAESQQIIFYANVDGSGDVERIRYYFQNGKIYKGVVKPSGSPVIYNLASEVVTLVQGGIFGSPTLFTYFDDTYNGVAGIPLVQPVNVTAVRFIKMDVPILNTAGQTGVNSFTVTAMSTVRSLKTNLAANTPPPAIPTVNLQVNSGNGPITVAYNASATLTWLSTNSTNCTASGSWSGSVGTTGSQSTGGLVTSQTYTLTCSGAGGSASDSVTVNVSPPPAPTVDLRANGLNGPLTLAYNSAVTLTWTSTTTSSCTASGSWSGSKSLNGSTTTSALTESQTYILTCDGPGGSANDSVVVNISSPPPVQPSCTSATPQNWAPSGNGELRLDAYGVQNTTSLNFKVHKGATSIDVAGSDQGGGNWSGTFSLSLISGKGWYTVDVYVTNENASNVFCASTLFRRK